MSISSKKIKLFETETQRIKYAQKLAKEKLDALSTDVQLQWGRAHLLISLEREILDTLPRSQQHRKKHQR